MPKDKSSGKKLADMMYGNPEGAAFGVFPQMKGKRSRQDPEAAKNFPVDLARGVIAGAVGMPGDIESLARLPYELITGNESPTILPTSEDVLKRIPFGSDTPASQFASGLGTLAGGSANIGAAPRMVKKGALAAGRAGERMAEKVVPGIMERGGAGADILSGLAQGTQSKIFIGPKAKTFNQARADEAVAMEKAGRTPQEIWLATGTFRGADGILRQEIDDRAAKFLSADERKERLEATKGKIAELKEKIKPTPQKDLFPKALTEAKKEVRDDISILQGDVKGMSRNPTTQGLLAQHIFEHPELYAAYPELQNVNFVTEGGSSGSLGALSIMPSRGNYPGSMEIDIYDKGLRSNPTSTSLHEMQHAVQTLEGMGPGGNPTFAFSDPKASEMLQQERLKMLNPLPYEDFVRQGGYTDMEQAGRDYAKYTKDLQGGIDPAYDRMLQQRVAMEYYKRLAGEAEARAVQDRQMMTPAQRMETPPPASYDVPQEDLIVKPPREYADGGRVHISDNPDVMQLEMAGGGLVKGLKAAVKATKAGADAPKPIVEAPGIIIPSKIQNVREAVRNREGSYGAKRVERAADEIRNLEKMFTEEALRSAFTGDNAKAVVTMNPADFEKYANMLMGRTQADIGPRMAELAKQGEIDKHTVPTDEYIQHLMRVQGGFDQVPYLNLYKDEVGLPIKPEVRGHEGRHRNRALSAAGEPSTLVEINPRGDLREGLPRRSQEEYIEALREELGLSDRLVLPQTDGTSSRPAIILPEPYAEGGEVSMAAGGLARALKATTKAVKGAQDVLPAAEREANKAKFLEGSKTPMRLYHGTTATEGGKGTEAIRRIKPSKEGSLGSGVYLTPSSAHASGYSGVPNDEALEMMLSSPYQSDTALQLMNKRNAGEMLPGQEGGNMLPVYAQLRNPLIIEGKGDPMVQALVKLGMDEESASKMVERAYEQKGYIGKQVQQRAQAAGYDGLMQFRDGELSEVVSYNPNAVKSAIGNRGTYDINDPDLNKAGGGEVSMAAGGISKLARLARAPAKSKQEIQAIAERIAPQVTGEYVRKDAKTAKTVAGKTQKQFQREKTLPVDVRPTAEERIPEVVDIEKLKGDVMIGVPGDPTLTGKTLYGVGDFTLGSPSPQHGGPLYGLYSDDAFWASGIGPARGVQNLAKRASKQYDAPVKGSYIMMGPDSINYAQHFADANLQAIDLSRMTKAQIEQFNELIRKGSKKSGPRDSFPGIEDKDSAYLHMAMDPELRKHFNALMQKPTVTEPLNLPSGTDIRFAITEPALRDLETGVTGFSMGRMRPDIPSKDLPLSTHPTYSHDIPGEFLGQSRFPVPYELSFPDTLQSIRANPKQARQEFGSLKMVGPRQIIDQQMIDEIKTYNEYMKRLTGKNKGGAVRKAAGGEITADDLILEERKL